MPDITKLSELALARLGEKRREASSKNCTALIQAGFHDWTGDRIREAAAAPGANPLFLDYVKVTDAVNEVYAEEARRQRWHGSMRPIREKPIRYR